MKKSVKIILRSIQIEKGIGSEFSFLLGGGTPFKVNFSRKKLRQVDKVVYAQNPEDTLELSRVTLRLDIVERDPKFNDTGQHRMSFNIDYDKPTTELIVRRKLKAKGGDAPREIEIVYRFEVLIEAAKAQAAGNR